MARKRPNASDVSQFAGRLGDGGPAQHVPLPTAPPRLVGMPATKRQPYDQWAPDVRALNLVGDKWTLLIVRDLAAGPRRFVELQRVLPGISTEQLRTRLKRMVADGLLTRMRYREVPPRVDYELTPRSKELLMVLGALGRWGYDWAWGMPREAEAVDIGAILRVATGLVALGPDARGVVSVAVEVDDRTIQHYTLTVREGRLGIEEREVLVADARVAGGLDEWIDALGPTCDLDGLRVDGDEDLAYGLLAAIGGRAERREGATPARA